jgi:quercetin dioxygenase-like cupin family protein
MRIVTPSATTKAAADHFTGDAWIDRITEAELPSRIRVSAVRFAPGARNAWHAHSAGQWLRVTEGVGRVQSRGADVVEVRAGDTVYAAPGEWHWHGAAPDHFMTHLAMWEATEGASDPEWGEQVSDEEYSGLPQRLGAS